MEDGITADGTPTTQQPLASVLAVEDLTGDEAFCQPDNLQCMAAYV